MTAVASLASGLIIDTGEFAEEFGHAGGVYLSHFIPAESIPNGKKSVVAWIEGFSYMFTVIRELFEKGEIPTFDKLTETLNNLPKDKKKLVKAYGKAGANVENILEALIGGAKHEWEDGDFQVSFCDCDWDDSIDPKWDDLPTCKKHDLDWTLMADLFIE